MNRPPSREQQIELARHNAGVVAARREHVLHPIAFAVDHLCETCQTFERDHSNRKCVSCRGKQRRAA